MTDLKRVKSTDDVSDTMSLFLNSREDVRQRVVTRLQEIKSKLDQSVYFKRHEVVGSSILILYDDVKVGAWLIDFAKTRPVPEGITLNHRVPWSPGNHEEGFLFGLDNLIRVSVMLLLTFFCPEKGMTHRTTGSANPNENNTVTRHERQHNEQKIWEEGTAVNLTSGRWTENKGICQTVIKLAAVPCFLIFAR